MNDAHSQSSVAKPTLVGLGEVLFDCFPDREVLGGAPINLTVHAHALLSQLGGRAVPATRVGSDQRGRQILDTLAGRGIDTDCIQTDDTRPTGTVQVTLSDKGNASYVFTPNSAWDAFEFTGRWQQLAATASAVCFGTLGQRSETSKQSIQQFLQAANSAIRVFDVNFRQQFYSAELVQQSLDLATAMKLSDEELPKVCQLLGINSQQSGEQSTDDQAFELARRYNLQWVALTRGPLGTTLYTGGEKHEGQPVPATGGPDADTVGAGDACCAGLVVGALLGWQPQRTLRLANTLGAYVASHKGATPVLPSEILQLVTE